MDMTGPKNVGYDVADDGQDRCCAVAFNGAIASDLDAWKAGEDELDESAMRAWKMRGNGKFLYDCIGVGAGVGSTLKTAGHNSGYYKFHAGATPKNPNYEYSKGIKNGDKFENRKAQAWTSVADRLRNTYNAITKGAKYEPNEMISISSEIDNLEQLKNELSMPHRVTSERGKDMVEKKSVMKRRLKSEISPDLADAFIMAACPHLADNNDAVRFNVSFYT
jgi:phage terminase large subunit